MRTLSDQLHKQDAEQIETLRLERADLLAELSAARRRIHEAEALRDAVFGLTKPALQVPRWLVRRSTAHDGSEHIPVLCFGDAHWGEVVSAGRMGGVNSYDVANAETRYRRLIEKTVAIAHVHLPKNRYPGLVYLRLGDMISGEIHADFRETNELQSVPAIRSLVAAELWGLQTLAARFGRVHVVSVPGNHARLSEQPQSKRGFDNLDTLSAWWLESALTADKRVTFYTPESGDACITLYGRRYLVTHGDKIGSRGGEGFIGPGATIARGMKRIHDQYARLGQPLAGCFLGHFHVALELEYGFANGSLIGVSEYARDGRMTPTPPVQWLIFFHRSYGPTSRWQLRLEDDPVAREVVAPFEVA
jgi:hypothetical protein